MKPYKVVASGTTADLQSLRDEIRSLRGDARCRPGDCTQLRFLVRDGFASDFKERAAAHGFRVEPDSREPFASPSNP